jgi:hypothetical protein
VGLFALETRFSITNEKGDVIAAKLLVYADEPEEYYTFITPEAEIPHKFY